MESSRAPAMTGGSRATRSGRSHRSQRSHPPIEAGDPPARAPARGELRRRRHRRWRPRSRDRLLPGARARGAASRGARALVHRLGGHRPQHHGAARQLQDAGDDPLLQGELRPLSQPGRGARLQSPALRARAVVARALRGADQQSARTRAAEPGLRCRHRLSDRARSGRGLPGARHDLRRRAADPRRGLSPAGLDHPPRRRRLGLRRGGRAARGAGAPGRRGHRCHRRPRPLHRCAHEPRRDRRGGGSLGRRRLRHADRRHGRVEAADRHSPFAGFRHPVVQAGARPHRGFCRPAHLCLAERPRRDAGRGRDRSLHLLLDALDLPLRLVVRCARHRSLSVHGEPPVAASVVGGLRHDAGLFAAPGHDAGRAVLPVVGLGDLGLQGDSGLGQATWPR